MVDTVVIHWRLEEMRIGLEPRWVKVNKPHSVKVVALEYLVSCDPRDDSSLEGAKGLEMGWGTYHLGMLSAGGSMMD